MLNFVAKLTLDASSFARGLVGAGDGAKKVGNKIGKEVGQDFVKGMKRTIGAGALVGTALSIGREAQEIRNMAAAMGVTEQQYAAMEKVTKSLGDASNVSAEEVRRLADELIAAGDVATSEQYRELAEAADGVEKAFTNTKQILIDVIYYVSLLVERMIRLGRVAMLPLTAGAAGVMTLAKGGSFKQADEAVRDMMVETVKDVVAPSRLRSQGGSIAERAIRNEGAGVATEDHMAALGADFMAKRDKMASGHGGTSLRSASSGGLQSIGLGPALGNFSFARDMVSAQKDTTEAVNRLATIVRTKL